MMNGMETLDSEKDVNLEFSAPPDRREPHPEDNRIGLAKSGPTEKRMKVDDFTEFDKLVCELASELKLARHPDSSVVIKAAHLMLEESIARRDASDGDKSSAIDSQAARELQQPGYREKNPDDKRSKSNEAADRTIQRSKLTLANVPLPKMLISKHESQAIVSEQPNSNDLSDALERAYRALKSLYLHDQRQLQDQVNELLTSIQAITANPKTNSRLMAVGR